MKKLSFLFICFIFMTCYLSSLCFGIDYQSLDRSLKKALQLKEAGDNDGAIVVIEKTLSGDFIEKELKPGIDDEDIYTRDYLTVLLDCLKGNEIVYASVVKHTTSIVENTKEVFSKIAGKLESGEFSPEDIAAVKEIRSQISRERVVHNFCIPPQGYSEVYAFIQSALFRYSKAWNSLEIVASGKTEENTKVGAEALANFQRGNELFSQAGILMRAIPTIKK